MLAACSEVLSDDRDTPSLIGVFAGLDVLPPPNSEIQPNALSPKSWVMFSLWLAESNDIGREFTQKMQITTPDGVGFGESSQEFKMTALTHTLKIAINGMPVGMPGKLTVEVWVESHQLKVTDKHRYEITIQHSKKAK